MCGKCSGHSDKQEVLWIQLCLVVSSCPDWVLCFSSVDSIDLPSIEEDAPSSSGDVYENSEKGRPHIFSVSLGKKHF